MFCPRFSFYRLCFIVPRKDPRGQSIAAIHRELFLFSYIFWSACFMMTVPDDARFGSCHFTSLFYQLWIPRGAHADRLREGCRHVRLSFTISTASFTSSSMRPNSLFSIIVFFTIQLPPHATMRSYARYSLTFCGLMPPVGMNFIMVYSAAMARMYFSPPAGSAGKNFSSHSCRMSHTGASDGLNESFLNDTFLNI